MRRPRLVSLQGQTILRRDSMTYSTYHCVLSFSIASDDKLKLMSIVVAGFNRNHSNLTVPVYGNDEKPSNSTWKSQCRMHGQGQTNPYIRAIFSYIASGDWRDVLEEKSLSLADRVGVALRFLGDDEVILRGGTLQFSVSCLPVSCFAV